MRRSVLGPIVLVLLWQRPPYQEHKQGESQCELEKNPLHSITFDETNESLQTSEAIVPECCRSGYYSADHVVRNNHPPGTALTFTGRVVRICNPCRGNFITTVGLASRRPDAD
jgi:hypothetical protein